MDQAVILAGGKGTRLRERLDGRPKPLVDVAGEPLLGRQLALLRRDGFQDVIVLVSYGADQIEKFCKNSKFSDLKISIVCDRDSNGTAGALIGAFTRLNERFLVVYGDTLLDVDLVRFWTSHIKANADASLFVHPNSHPFDSDLIEVDDDGWVSSIHSPPHEKAAWLPNLVNAALYVIERRAIEFWRARSGFSDIARDLFPAMLAKGAKLKTYNSFEYISDIGTPARLDRALGQLRTGFVERARIDRPQKAVFLDRDGTLNKHRGYITRAEDLVLFEGVADAVKTFNDTEFRTVLVTNQPVIARGECSFNEMRRIHARIQTELGDKGAFLDRIYVCPHHPDRGFAGEVAALKIECKCRKPATGLIETACADLNVEIQKSWLIGDTTSDVLAANRLGLRSILLETGMGGRDYKYPIFPDFVAKDLRQAAFLITQTYPKLSEYIVSIRPKIQPGGIVLIGGLSRQGKSTFAGVLRSALIEAGIKAEVLHLDGFIRDHDRRQPTVFGRFNLDELYLLLAPWLARFEARDFEVPIYDRIQRKRIKTTNRLRVAADSVLIIEGVPALGLALQTERHIYRILIDGEEKQRRRRVIDDLVNRGYSQNDAEEAYLTRNLDESPFIREQASSAELVINYDKMS